MPSAANSNRKRKNTSNYKDTLSTLAQEIEEKEKDLEAREDELRRDKEALEKDRLVVYHGTNSNDVLKINIGGTIVSVLRRTLTAIPGSMLASKFSGRWDDSIERDADGNFYIDQDYEMFWYVIHHLRNMANGDGVIPQKSPKIRDGEKFQTIDFYRMLEYYGLMDGFYPVTLRSHKNGSTQLLNSRSFDKSEFTTLTLVPVGHNRKIKTYEVTLGQVEHIELGWIHTGCTKRSYNSFKDIDYQEEYGLHDTPKVVALDVIDSSLFTVLTAFKREKNEYVQNPRESRFECDSLDMLECSVGTIVRMESGKVWYVNGDQVASLTEKEWSEFHNNNMTSTHGGEVNSSYVPIISMIGSIEITSVTFHDDEEFFWCNN